jgi:hypothetical protein
MWDNLSSFNESPWRIRVFMTYSRTEVHKIAFLLFREAFSPVRSKPLSKRRDSIQIWPTFDRPGANRLRQPLQKDQFNGKRHTGGIVESKKKWSGIN